jgi:hypothetical protein
VVLASRRDPSQAADTGDLHRPAALHRLQVRIGRRAYRDRGFFRLSKAGLSDEKNMFYYLFFFLSGNANKHLVTFWIKILTGRAVSMVSWYSHGTRHSACGDLVVAPCAM